MPSFSGKSYSRSILYSCFKGDIKEIARNSRNQANLYDEAMLTRSASAGNLEVFNQLTLHYQNTAHGHAYYLLGDTSLAEDTTQESFLKAFQALNTFRRGSFHSGS